MFNFSSINDYPRGIFQTEGSRHAILTTSSIVGRILRDPSHK